MISIAKKKLMTIAEVAHRRVFGHEMSDEMRGFLKNLSWSFFGGFIAALIMFIVNVFAGRILGPLEFGKYNYILSLAVASGFFFLLGNDTSSIRYISDKSHGHRKGRFLSALLFLTLIQSLIFLLAVSIFRNFISNIFNINYDIVYFVFLLSAVLSFKGLFDSFIRSFEMFKKQSMAKIIDAVLVLGIFLFLYFFFGKVMTYKYYAEAMMSGASFSIIYFLYSVRKYFRKFSKEEIKIIYHYNKFLILGGVSGFIMSLEKVFIGKYIGIESLGVYSAYYASSHMIVSNVGILFMNTFWPAIVKNRDNMRPVVEKLNKIFLKYFPIWFIINFVSVYFFLSFYGSQYPATFLYVLLFSLSSLTNIFFFIFMNFMNVDRLAHATAINTIIFVIFVASIAIFKSISAYLIVQIIIYLIGIVYIRKRILSDASKIS